MAALAANTANVQILHDDHKLVIARLFLYQNTAGDESSVTKIDAETLRCRTFQLTINPAAGVNFQPGDLITGSVSGATGFVTRPVDPGSNTLYVTETTGTFVNTDNVTTQRLSPQITANVTAVTTPVRQLSLESVWYCTDASSKIGLEFANSSVFATALLLGGGVGFLSKNDLAQVIVSPQVVGAGANGNLFVSTYGVPAKGGYTMIIALTKDLGYTQKPGY